MFRRALKKLEEHEDRNPWDNGSHQSDDMYHGSDQSIFSIIMGEQEFQRWVMRLRHLSTLDKARGFGKLPTRKIEGTLIDNPIDPSFTHQPMEHKEGKPDEFGIGMDYASEIIQQTIHSDSDAAWLVFNRNVTEQLEHRHGLFDCPSRARTGELPKHIAESEPPLKDIEHLNEGEKATAWEDVSLYTNLCLNTVPAMVSTSFRRLFLLNIFLTQDIGSPQWQQGLERV